MTLDELRAKGAGRMKEMALIAAGTLLAMALVFPHQVGVVQIGRASCRERV